MAIPWRFVRSFLTSSSQLTLRPRIIVTKKTLKWKKTLLLIACVSTGVSYYYWEVKKINTLNDCQAGLIDSIKTIEILNFNNNMSRLSNREKLFIKFASVELDGSLYMTPEDFLESVIKAEPRPRSKLKSLNSKDMEEIRVLTPYVKKSTVRTFRNLGDKGIISYIEYLFLLSILTKPSAGFEIAFKMLDTGRNQKVDIKEFCVLLATVCAKVFKENILKRVDPVVVEQILSRHRSPPVTLKARKNQESGGKKNEENEKADFFGHAAFLTEILHNNNLINTTILLHLFGKEGKELIDFEQFAHFMVNLQTEVLEMEFLEFSDGRETITELDFARMLLRYSNTSQSKYEDLLTRLALSNYEKKGINFDEFRNFFMFLNNINDFGKVMTMYALARRPISESEFQRAVKMSTGIELTKNVVHATFLIFDEDGDGKLTYNEFIAIMKDRLHRGLHQSQHPSGWKGFKVCVRQKTKRTI